MKLDLVNEVMESEELIDAIKNSQEDIDLYVNSPGGDVFAGFQIIDAIKNCEHNVTAHVHVMSASIAAVITLACDKFTITKNDLMLLHNCWTLAIGNKEELAEEIEIMEKIDGILHNIIAENCSDPEAVIAKMNKKDYWLTGEEVAELFNNCELIEYPAKENRLVASGSLADMVRLHNQMQEMAIVEEPQQEEIVDEIVEETIEEPEPYVMDEKLKELLEYDE